MKIRLVAFAFATSVLFNVFDGLASRAAAQIDPTLPNMVPMFPDTSRVPNNFVVTNRLGGPTLEFEILTSNIGGQDWVRPPIDRSAVCFSSTQYFRMPQTHQYTIYWYDPDLGDYTLIDQRRKNTICIQDDPSRGRDPQNYCLHDHEDA